MRDKDDMSHMVWHDRSIVSLSLSLSLSLKESLSLTSKLKVPVNNDKSILNNLRYINDLTHDL